jgi:hypothetical protein
MATVVSHGERARADGTAEMSRVVHDLANTLNSLALRLQVLERSQLAPAARDHSAAAVRLARESASLVQRLRTIRDQLLPDHPGPEQR